MIIILEDKDLLDGHKANSPYNFRLPMHTINHADFILYVDTVNKTHKALKERSKERAIFHIKKIIENL